jgi:hypothetical protein
MLLTNLNEQNVIIDIFLKEAHLYDKLINHFDFFFRETFYIYMYFFKRKIKKAYSR